MRVILAMTARQPGGVWRHVADLAGGLRARGVDVSLALDPAALDLVERARGLGVGWIPLADSLRAHCDVWHLHLHDTFDAGGLALIAKRAVRPGARVATEHLPHTNASDPSLLRGRRRPGAYVAKTIFKRTQMALLDRVIAVSADAAAFMASRYGVHWARLVAVPNGVATKATTAVGNRGPAMEVLCAGSLIVQKGFETVVEARAIATEEWNLTIAGDGPARTDLEALACRAGVADRIRLLGWRDDVRGLMEAADVVCVPSRWEASSYVALDAMSVGLPVVATSVDGVREIVADGVSGHVVPPEDPTALAAALDRLALIPEVRRHAGLEGRARVERLFTLDLMVERTLDVYRSAAE